MQRGTLRIGTCSWTEETLVKSGTFYPRQVVSAEARLRYYASHFDTVEVESSFYAVPGPRMVSAWLERTPPGFLFHFKAHAAFTGHPLDARQLPAPVREMLPAADRDREDLVLSDAAALKMLSDLWTEALIPLKEGRRLGFVVLQFPPWFGYSKAHLEHLARLKDLFNRLPLAVEFRHGSWLTSHHADCVMQNLREQKISYITCDEPQLGTLATVPFCPGHTTSVAYLRLHGRNADNWLQHTTPRYDYRYRSEELEQLATAALKLCETSRLVFVMFNNCHAGHAVSNALHLRQIIQTTTQQRLGDADASLQKTSC